MKCKMHYISSRKRRNKRKPFSKNKFKGIKTKKRLKWNWFKKNLDDTISSIILNLNFDQILWLTFQITYLFSRNLDNTIIFWLFILIENSLKQ